ncbi:MAG: FkbM family methyltransferase [Pseudomonadota bacterium]
MKKIIGSILKKIIKVTVVFLGKTTVGRYIYQQVISDAMNQTKEVVHQGVKLYLSTPNWINKYRADSFSTKEPETLEWYDGIPEGSVVWDIGANVGLYTCYAAKARGCKVYAFEPSVFNLELLARNIYINGLTDQVVIVPLPLSDNLAINKLNMSTTDWGGALSTFGQSYGHDGLTLNNIFEFQTLGVSMTEAMKLLKIPQPDYIKMDVDGIEHLILKGGNSVLKYVKGVLIEINEEFEKQTVDSARYLSEAGLVFKEKRHAEEFNDTICFNQIWSRSSE